MRVAAIFFLTMVLQGTPPQVRQVQEWFEAGRYQQIVDTRSTWWHRATIGLGRPKMHGACIWSCRRVAMLIRGGGSGVRRTRS